MQLSKSAKITIYPPDRQGTGAFDGGKITEIKPIDFPGGTSAAKRIGPLFYWAWASVKGDGVIGLHPHQGFEIMSYVIAGEIGHSDTLGTESRVGAGGAQVMQTGSGVYHQEEMFGEQTEFFQIWLEPDLQKAIKQPPTYAECNQHDFPVTDKNGASIKTIIGEGAPISIVAKVTMDDVTIQPGDTYHRSLGVGNCLAVVAIHGKGTWYNAENDNSVPFTMKDFSVIEAGGDTNVSVRADQEDKLRLAIIEVPSQVEYPLYGE